MFNPALFILGMTGLPEEGGDSKHIDVRHVLRQWLSILEEDENLYGTIMTNFINSLPEESTVAVGEICKIKIKSRSGPGRAWTVGVKS